MADVVLTINNLTKHFGHIHAVEDVSLEVRQGEVCGILGPNGSGKTTTLGMILGVINPTQGSYSWFGKPPSHTSRKRIGSILEQPLFYPYLSAIKNLQIICDIKEVSYHEIDKNLELVSLYDRRNSKFSTFSYGMRQRMAIAAALLCSPDVLILDEPTNGLDPQGIAEVRTLINRVATEGITIILASHLLDEVQKTCSHVVVLEKGKKLFYGNVNEILSETVLVEISTDHMDKLKLAISQYDKVVESVQEGDRLIVKLSGNTSTLELNRFLYKKGIVLSHLAQRKKTLEKYFLELLDKS
ncbi:MAG: ATP-binding cassette domain-containing protein [Bacteroidetes bacterium]|nr:ATP-binding cassette domain-containing protein [Bacteroidota bacterium]